MSLSSPFFGKSPMTKVVDENGVLFDAGPKTFGTTAPGSPFFFINNDSSNKWGHILSEDKISYPPEMMEAIRHDWKKRGYTDGAIDSYIENFSQPAKFQVEFDADTGMVDLVIKRSASETVSFKHIKELNLLNSALASLFSDIHVSEPFATYITDAAVVKQLDFSGINRFLAFGFLNGQGHGSVDTTDMESFIKKASMGDKYLSFFQAVSKDGMSDEMYLSNMQLLADRMSSIIGGRRKATARRLYSIDEIIEKSFITVPANGFSYQQLCELSSNPLVRVIIAEVPVPIGSVLIFNANGLFIIDGLNDDPLTGVFHCLLVHPTKLVGGLIHMGTSHLSYGTSAMVRKSFVEDPLYIKEVETNPTEFDSGITRRNQTTTVTPVKVLDSITVERTRQLSKLFKSGNIYERLLNHLFKGSNSTAMSTEFPSKMYIDTNGDKYYGGISSEASVDIDELISAIWPPSLPSSGYCYSSLPSSIEERFSLASCRTFEHVEGYSVLMGDVSLIRIKTSAKLIADVLDFKISVKGNTSDEQAVLHKARSDLGTHIDREIFFTEYARPIKLVEDCVKTLALYKKFKDAVNIYEEEFIPADDNGSAVSFKSAQNSVNKNLERRIFGHSFFEPFVPTTHTEYDPTKVEIVISRNTSSPNRLVSDKNGKQTVYVANLCYVNSGNAVPNDSVLDLDDIMVWIHFGCNIRVEDESIASDNKLDYVSDVIFGKTFQELTTDSGKASESPSYDLDITPFMDTYGYFNWAFVPEEQRGLVSLMMAGVPANDTIALQLKRLFSFNVGSAVIGPEFFLGMTKL